MEIKNLLYIIPIMIFYLFESILVALFVNVVWQFFLSHLFGLHINYIEWVAIIWIIKVLFFDLFKLMAGIEIFKNNNNNIKN